MLDKLFINYEETVSVILFCIGFSTMLLNKNHIKGRTVPIVVDGIQSVEAYINPIPAGLVLTGIVVSVSVSALMLSLTIRIYKKYHTLDIDTLYVMMSDRRKGGRV